MWCNTFHFSKPVDFTAQKLCNMTLSCWLTELLLSNLKVMEMLDCEYSRCKKAANNIIFFYQNEKNNYFSVINNNTSVCIYSRVIQLWLLSTLFVNLKKKSCLGWSTFILRAFSSGASIYANHPLTTVLYEVENLQQHTQCSVILKHPLQV